MWQQTADHLTVGMGAEKVVFFDDANTVFTPIIENIGSKGSVIYTNGFGVSDNYNFSLKFMYDFENGFYNIITQRRMTSTEHLPHFSKFYYYK